MELDTDILWEESVVEEAPASPPEDHLQSLVQGEEDLFTATQLVGMVDSPSQMDPVLPPPRSAEVEAALQPIGFSCYKDVKEEEAALLESQEDSEM